MAGEHMKNETQVDVQLVIKILSDKIAELTTQNAILIAQLNAAQKTNEKDF
jgi:hypothetical protein